MAGERLEELSLDHVHTLHDGGRIRHRRIDVREAADVIERVDDAADEQAHAPELGLLPVAHRALAEVLVFGGKPKVPLVLLAELGQLLGDRLVEGGRFGTSPVLGLRGRVRSGGPHRIGVFVHRDESSLPGEAGATAAAGLTRAAMVSAALPADRP